MKADGPVAAACTIDMRVSYMTASSDLGSNGGSCQLRSRVLSVRKHSAVDRTLALSVSTKYFEPVTVPTPPKEIVAKMLFIKRVLAQDHAPCADNRTRRRQLE